MTSGQLSQSRYTNAIIFGLVFGLFNEKNQCAFVKIALGIMAMDKLSYNQFD